MYKWKWIIGSNTRIEGNYMETESKELLEAASTGHLVLFLGAGANAGSTIGLRNRSVLLGNSLSLALAARFFPGEAHSAPSLRATCRDIVNNYGRDQLREALIDLLIPVNPSAAMAFMPRIGWSGIYTVNVDDAVERAYETSPQRVQNLCCPSNYSD